MRSLKWLTIIVSGVLALASYPDLGHSQGTNEETNYIVVTLDEFTVNQISPTVAPIFLKLMLGSVSASGHRVQKNALPAFGWIESSPGLTHLEEEGTAVPLFALPEDELGEELSFALVLLNNDIPEDQSPENWVSMGLPAVLEATSNPIALWVNGQILSAQEEANRVSAVIAPLLGGNSMLGIITAKFSQSQDWGVRDAMYEARANNGVVEVKISYRIQRISVSPAASVRVQLKNVISEDSERADESPIQLFTWSQSASDFRGESLNGLLRRLPFSGSLQLEENSTKALDELIYKGELGPFLYLNLGIWEGGSELVTSTGVINRFWTVDALSDGLSASFEVVFGRQDEGSVRLEFEVQVEGLPAKAQNLALNKPVKVSNALAVNPPEMAVDGILFGNRNWWGAGDFPPQWIEIDLQASATVEMIRLFPSQQPFSAKTRHLIWGKGSAEEDYQLLHEFYQITTSTIWVVHQPETPWENIRFVKVETVESPSWVSWIEIEIIGISTEKEPDTPEREVN